jgi:hypothetical protein
MVRVKIAVTIARYYFETSNDRDGGYIRKSGYSTILLQSLAHNSPCKQASENKATGWKSDRHGWILGRSVRPFVVLQPVGTEGLFLHWQSVELRMNPISRAADLMLRGLPLRLLLHLLMLEFGRTNSLDEYKCSSEEQGGSRTTDVCGVDRHDLRCLYIDR